MSDYFVQLPPDSTGKKSTMICAVSLGYTGHSPQVMAEGATVTGATSGAYGAITRVLPDGGDPTTGIIDILMDTDSPTIVFTDLENLQINASTVAQADGVGDSNYTQKTVTAGGNNPHNIASVDAAGALYVRNTEGAPQYDAFGLVRGAAPTLLAEYTFNYGQSFLFQESMVGSGAISHIVAQSSMGLDVGIGNTDSAVMRSNLYHRYQPGFGQYINMTVQVGDPGKANNIRRWGYFDDNDGVFFVVDETGFGVCMRSSTSGSPVDTVVYQEDWNKDKLGGVGNINNLSKIDINVMNVNIYWIDFAWLGAGKVRFGVFDDDGGRVTCHEFRNPNSQPVPYMRTGSLPVAVENYNTGVTASSSSIKLTCCSVMTDGRVIPDRKRVSIKRSFVGPGVSGITTEVPLATFRSRLLIGAITNRKISIPEFIAFNVVGGGVILRVRKNATLVGEVFSGYLDSALELDNTASSATGGELLISYILPEDAQTIEAPKNFGVQGENIKLRADGTYGDTYTMTAESVDGVTPITVRGSMTWIDID